MRSRILHPQEIMNIEYCRLKIEDLWNSAYFILNACCLPEEGDSSRRIGHRADHIPGYTMIRSRRDQLLNKDHKKGGATRGASDIQKSSIFNIKFAATKGHFFQGLFRNKHIND